VASELSAIEIRVLGCLLEKELATPQYYPLTMNALVLACNQTSNRDPIVTLTEAEVAGAIATLRDQALVRVVHSPGQRADKYREAMGETLGLDDQHRAVLAVLLLRGPQTVGELRIRTERMASFDSLVEVETVLGLLARRDEPLALHLDRAPGQKEARWMQLLGGPNVEQSSPGTGLSAAASMPEWPPAPRLGGSESGSENAVDSLRAEVAELRGLVEVLADRMREIEELLA
jgi:uncharacterized protein YceH (UPF0502 family)